MRVLEPWVAQPLTEFLRESAARVVLVMTSSGQVIAQHGFTRSLDVMSAAALGAGILATTGQIASLVGSQGQFGAVVHQGKDQGVWLAGFDTPRGRWVGLVVFGQESNVGLVRMFFERFAEQVRDATPDPEVAREVLAEGFERELDSSLSALFGRS
jgi:predicted regulator of Ras-like GTPase activity (Roadblock/LC7/MglB family)